MSVQVHGRLPGMRRAFNFLSRSEFVIALLLLYLGVREVREQFPLWPWAHAHPLSRLPGLSSEVRLTLPSSVGLLELAHDAGINHGFEIGNRNVPYIATTDLAVTVDFQGRVLFCAIAVKPHSVLQRRERRPLERIELERLYQAQLKEHHAVASYELVGKILSRNLEFVATGSQLPTKALCSSRLRDFSEGVSNLARSESINYAIQINARSTGFTLDLANLAFRWAVWHRYILVDLTEHLDMNRPISGTGEKIYSSLSNHLLGVDITSRMNRVAHLP